MLVPSEHSVRVIQKLVDAKRLSTLVPRDNAANRGAIDFISKSPIGVKTYSPINFFFFKKENFVLKWWSTIVLEICKFLSFFKFQVPTYHFIIEPLKILSLLFELIRKNSTTVESKPGPPHSSLTVADVSPDPDMCIVHDYDVTVLCWRGSVRQHVNLFFRVLFYLTCWGKSIKKKKKCFCLKNSDFFVCCCWCHVYFFVFFPFFLLREKTFVYSLPRWKLLCIIVRLWLSFVFLHCCGLM